MTEVVVVPTGTANLASVLAALRRAGLEPALSREPARIAAARAVVLPGVGHFAPAMEGLRADGLVAPIARRIAEERPLLAICLGLQVLAEESEEAPGVPGIGALPVAVTRFPVGVRCPHLGWAPVAPSPDARLLTEGYACFAHSFRITAPPPGWAWARAEHGGPFVAAIERGPMLGCQLHPELSGAWGADLLRRWAARCEEG
jgi:glutamine amidotransferase